MDAKCTMDEVCVCGRCTGSRPLTAATPIAGVADELMVAIDLVGQLPDWPEQRQALRALCRARRYLRREQSEDLRGALAASLAAIKGAA